MAIEYVFDDGKYSVSVRDLKATVFDIVSSAASKADELQNRAASEEDKDLQAKLVKLSSLLESCSRDIYKATSSLVGSLQKLDSYSEELKILENGDVKEKSSDGENGIEFTTTPEMEKIELPIITTESNNQGDAIKVDDVPNIISNDTTSDLIESKKEQDGNGLSPIIPESNIVEAKPETVDNMYMMPVIEDDSVLDETKPVQENESTTNSNQSNTIIVSKDPTFPDRAILVTKVQGTKLRNSLESQKVFVNRENMESTVEQPVNNNVTSPLIVDPKKKIEDLLAQAKSLYDQGNLAEAQALYDEISRLNSESQHKLQGV